MAKGARASTKKANNARLKSKVFGPVEAARLERLAAKTDALRAQPKPAPPGELTMDIEEGRCAVSLRDCVNPRSVTIEEKVEPAALDAQTDGMLPELAAMKHSLIADPRDGG